VLILDSELLLPLELDELVLSDDDELDTDEELDSEELEADDEEELVDDELDELLLGGSVSPTSVTSTNVVVSTSSYIALNSAVNIFLSDPPCTSGSG
jgi:hypothetical protein